MRKRLIERFTHAKRGSLGYTLTEMLMVIAIIAVACSIAIPSIISVSKAIRFAQANNYAKSVFMAAQQNLTELRSEGGLTALQAEHIISPAISEGHCGFPAEEWSDEYVYTASNMIVNAASGQVSSYSLVLPVNSIDGTVRNQQVIIEYNPLTGNVFSVFYCEDADTDILDLYRSGRLPRDKAQRKKLMVGYYDGSGLSSSQLDVEHSNSRMEFTNGQEGVATVIVDVPDDYIGYYSEFIRGLSVRLTVEGVDASGQPGEFEILVKEAGDSGDNCSIGTDGKTIRITCVLDSLANRSSFANYSAGISPEGGNAALTTIANELAFQILPGENVTLTARIGYEAESGRPEVAIDTAILDNVNPMFEYMEETTAGHYVLAVSNGRNLQNLNAISPTVAKKVDTVVFTGDINWNDTVSYYNAMATGGAYRSESDEAPARSLPHFVPIHNENLFGTARFIYLDGGEDASGLEGVLQNVISSLFGGNFSRKERVPTLTDELDTQKVNGVEIGQTHAKIEGNGHKVSFLNIDSTVYQVPAGGSFYALGENQVIDYYFTGLFGYVNTSINDLHVVNPIVKGHDFVDEKKKVNKEVQTGTFLGIPQYDYRDVNASTYSDPATGALLGAGGYNTLITQCSVYLDTNMVGFNWSYANYGQHQAQGDYSASDPQDWYGVSGMGAVGGLVGYAKSHRTTSGKLDGDLDHLAFSNCFAAVPVSGTMRGDKYEYDKDLFGGDDKPDKDFGYSNGVGGFIGNSQLTNFYNCYSSGTVRASNAYSQVTSSSVADSIITLFGLGGNGRLSMGAGGFVGTSHGTRYTNCFSTGSVKNANGKTTTGGFVGMMCYDETKAYGHNVTDAAESNIAQHTVFENCYSIGMCVGQDGSFLENFSGTNGKIDVSYGNLQSYYSADYYRLYAPYKLMTNRDPQYETHYIFKDSYYLSQYASNSNVSQDASNKCANPIGYSDLMKLQEKYDTPSWITNSDPDNRGQIEHIKNDYNLDAQFVTSILGMAKDIITDLYDDFADFLLHVGDDWNALEKAIKNSNRSTYDIYFNLYNFMRERNLRSGTLEEQYYARFDEGFPSLPWTNASEYNTHYYGESSVGKVYPFPVLSGLDYYGTWQEPPLAGGLAYYEQYRDGGNTTYGYYFDRSDTSNLNSDADTVILTDGYAVFSATASDTIRVYDESGRQIAGPLTPTGSINLSSPSSPDINSYYVTRLPELNVTSGNGGFYSAIRIEIRNASGSTSFWALYNPSTAISQINNVELNSSGKPYYRSDPDTILVRTARQFAELNSDSLHSVLDKDHTFVQQLNINAATYNWGTGASAPQVSGIGTEAVPFDAAYTTVGGYVEHATLTGFSTTSGYFGKIGPNGSVSYLTIVYDGSTVGSANEPYAGILAAVTSGTIDQVDLMIPGNLTVSAGNAAGLLVGQATKGTITDATGKTVETSAGFYTTTVNADGNVTFSTPGSAGGVAGLVTAAHADEVAIIFLKPVTANTASFGAFAGQAENLTADNTTVDLFGIGGTVPLAGGFAGVLKYSSLTSIPVVLEGNYQTTEDSVIAGLAATADSCAVQNATVTLNGALNAGSAAGMFGTASNPQVLNSHVYLDGTTISGTQAAAGFAVTADAGSIGGSSVNLTDGAIRSSAGQAAGFAVSSKSVLSTDSVILGGYTYKTGLDSAGKRVQTALNAITSRGTIEGATKAAGFACEVSNKASSTTVTGIGTITAGEEAAGFAVTISGNTQLTACGVTPALRNTAADYYGNSNRNLTITGTSVSGFAGEVGSNVNVSNCYALGKLVGIASGEVLEPMTAGFASVNQGILSGVTANVTIEPGSESSMGYGLVGYNSGLITDSYGWFGDGDPEECLNLTGSVTNTGSGEARSVYVVDIDIPLDSEPNSAVFYDIDCVEHAVDPATLTAEMLNGETGIRWFAPEVFEAYSYNKMNTGYVYPTLRAHYGNWATPPQYAAGIVYYELYDEGDPKVWGVNLSHPEIPTIDSDLFQGEMELSQLFNNEGTIIETGYAVFYRGLNTVQITGATISSEELDLNAYLGDDKTHHYIFRKLIPTADTFEAVVNDRESGEIVVSEVMDSWFAHGFGEIAVHTVRTESQLAHVSSDVYSQTHDISLSEGFAPLAELSGTYNGNGLLLDATAISGGLVTTVSGTLEDLFLDLGDLTAPVFGTVSGTVRLKDVTVRSVGTNAAIAGSVTNSFIADAITLESDNASPLFPAVSGTVTPGTVTIPALGAPLTGTVNGGTLTNAHLSATTVTENFSGNGLLASILGENGTISGSSVTVEEYFILANESIPAQSIYGTNAKPFGAVAGFVQPGAVISGTSAGVNMNVIGADNTLTVLGGIAGVSGGSVIQSSASTQILYTQTALSDTDDQIGAGGLVGWILGGGTLTDSTAEGAILLDEGGSGTGKDLYFVGGAVSFCEGTVRNTHVNVLVDAAWAKALNTASTATFGTSGIENNGPVGMFVGYAGAVTLENCSSTAENDTYQFLGEAAVQPVDVTGLWKSVSLQSGTLKAYSDRGTNGVLTTYDPAGIEFSAANSTNYILTNLSGCFFQLGEATKEQTYGVDYYYYDTERTRENHYTIATAAALPTNVSQNVTFTRGDYKDKGIVPTSYYYLDTNTNTFYPVSVKYSEKSYLNNMKFTLVETGNESHELASKEAKLDNWAYRSTFTLYTRSAPSLSGTYAAIDPSGYALDSAAVQHAIPGTRTFEQRDALAACIWNVSGNTITNALDGTVYEITATIPRQNGAVMVYTFGTATVNLYPVTVTANGSSYEILSFTYQTNANHLRQYITTN